MSQAIIVANRRIELVEGMLSIAEKSIVAAIANEVYDSVFSEGDAEYEELEEIVAQLFDALEEKEHENDAADAIAAMIEDAEDFTGPFNDGINSTLVHRLTENLEDERYTVNALAQEIEDLKKEAVASELVLKRLAEDKSSLLEQLDKLANFVLSEVHGEPAYNEGAVDTAIRTIRNLLTVNKVLSEKLSTTPSTPPTPPPRSPLPPQAPFNFSPAYSEAPPLPGSFKIQHDGTWVPYTYPPCGTKTTRGIPRVCKCAACMKQRQDSENTGQKAA